MSNEWLPALIILAAVYMVGGLHGLWLAWTQEARMQRWANLVHRTYIATHDMKEGTS